MVVANIPDKKVDIPPEILYNIYILTIK